MPAQEVESQLGVVPRILAQMGLDKAAQDYVAAAQKDPALNPDRLFGGDLAVVLRARAERQEIALPAGIDLSKATAANKNISLIDQAGKLAMAAADDIATLNGGNTLAHLPAPYYKSRVASPTIVDAQQATANFAANMVKEAARNPALAQALQPLVMDMVKLTAEIRQNPHLGQFQRDRLELAASQFAELLGPERAAEVKLDDYLKELKNEVEAGCASSAAVRANTQKNAPNVTPPTVTDARDSTYVQQPANRR